MRRDRASLCPVVGFRGPHGWSLTVLRSGEDARLRGVYTASCGGTLHLTIDRTSVVFEVRRLSALEEAMAAGKALVRAIELGQLAAAEWSPQRRPHC